MAGAFEGVTEKSYTKYLCQQYDAWVNFKGKVFEGFHGVQLIDKAVTYNQQLKRENPRIALISVVAYDLESVSRRTLAEAANAVSYGIARGIKVFVNAPTIERWFLMHATNASLSLSKAEVDRKLAGLIATGVLPAYDKPGTAPFFDALQALSTQALKNCGSAGHVRHEGTQIPCFCNLVEYLQSFQR